MTEQDTKAKPDRTLRRGLIAVAVVVAALMVPVTVYLGYDLLKSAIAPCDRIFEQTATNLQTEIKFLEAKGKVVLGEESLAELTERAQMTAINMEGCCQVLDAGKLDPEQFLQCKQSARQYQGDLENVVTLVKAALAAEAEELSGKIDEVSSQVAAAVESARSTSQDFNKRVVEVKRAQAIEQLEVTAPEEVAVEAQEQEPNNDVLNTNAIQLGEWITAAIGDTGDADYYTFTTPGVHRDWIQIELENRSTNLRPKLNLYNAEKVHFSDKTHDTHGANLTHHIVSAPSTKYYLRIGNYNNRSQGAYLLRVTPLHSYDAFEPNQGILEAKLIPVGEPVEAGLMDSGDFDYYRFETGSAGGTLTVSLENRSTGLRPKLDLYNADKVHLTSNTIDTHGANLRLQLAVEPNTAYFLNVDNYNNRTHGEYTLTIDVQ